MVRPISLRSAAILREARFTLARGKEEARLARHTKLTAFKALHLTRQAYDLEEKINSSYKLYLLTAENAIDRQWLAFLNVIS